LPFLRGVVTLFESMHNGYSALRFSADEMEKDLGPREQDGESTEEGSGGSSGVGTRLATVFAVVLFIALPQLLAWLVGRNVPVHSLAYQALTGVFKLGLILGYLLLIRRVPEVRTVFQYHGAEHKAIATYEAGE